MFRSKQVQLPVPESLVASAVQVKINDTSWRSYRLRDENWQSETWRLYDSIGEFRFSANYIGSAVSRVRLYVADVDDYGRTGEEVNDNEEIAAIADTLFGGPSAKAENLRLIGISLIVAGECYIIGKAAGGRSRKSGAFTDRDHWFVVSPANMRRSEGGLSFRYNGEVIKLAEGRDLVIRLWTPHPAHPDLADCAARSALPILIEMEQLTKYVFSQIDSRLAGAGLLPVPNNLSFPREDGEIGGSEDLVQALMDTASESLQGRGSAAGLVPMLVEMPIEALAAMKDKPITFESVLSEQAIQLRQEAQRRLATSLDMPPEVLEGAAESNHWGIWYVEENAIKIHVEPLMTRITDALTVAYLQPALRALGQEPDRFTFAFDTAPLTNRPNRLQDTLNLYERGIVSAEAVLRAGNYNPAIDAPEQDEETRRFIKELMLRDPGLFATPELREEIGISIEIAPPEMEETPPPPPPSPQREVTEDTSPTPQMPSATTPQNRTQQNLLSSGKTAWGPSPGLVPQPSAIEAVSHVLVRQALARAGGKLLTRSERGRWLHVLRDELHTRILVRDEAHATELLAGGFDGVAEAVAGLDVDPDSLHEALYDYSKTLLVRSMSHNRTLLNEVLQHKGLAT